MEKVRQSTLKKDSGAWVGRPPRKVDDANKKGKVFERTLSQNLAMSERETVRRETSIYYIISKEREAPPARARDNHHPPAHARVTAFAHSSAWAKENARKAHKDGRASSKSPVSAHEFGTPPRELALVLNSRATRRLASLLSLRSNLDRTPPLLAYQSTISRDDAHSV